MQELSELMQLSVPIYSFFLESNSNLLASSLVVVVLSLIYMNERIALHKMHEQKKESGASGATALRYTQSF